MFEKRGKFYADWRDARGNRRRKQLPTKQKALQFETLQKDLANPKTKGVASLSRRHSAPTSRPPRKLTTQTKQSGQQSSSSKRQVKSK